MRNYQAIHLFVIFLLLLALGGLPPIRPSIKALAQYRTTIRVFDQSPQARPVGAAPVTLTRVDVTPNVITHEITSAGGEIVDTFDEGTYDIVATSPNALYGKPATEITSTAHIQIPLSSGEVDLLLPIFDVTVTLVTPSRRSIVGATVTVGGHSETTDSSGDAVFPSIPSGSYTVAASWFGLNINPTEPLVVTGSGTVRATAGNIALVSVQVVGAQSQGLSGANVVVKTGTTTVFNGVASSDGTVALELPYGTYDFSATYKSVTGDRTGVAIDSDTTVTISTGIFIELFGQALSFAGFALYATTILIVLAGLAFLLVRRKRHAAVPPPPPPPPTN